jgi:hypothetical protein
MQSGARKNFAAAVDIYQQALAIDRIMPRLGRPVNNLFIPDPGGYLDGKEGLTWRGLRLTGRGA